MKIKADKTDVEKLVPVPVDLSKLIDVVKNVIKKDLCNFQLKNIQDKIPDITNLATNTTLNGNAEINEVKNEIPSITNLATTAALNAKINEVKNETPNITNLASTTAFTGVENKKLDHSKYIITSKFTAETFAARLAETKLASKKDTLNFIKKTDFDDKMKNLN